MAGRARGGAAPQQRCPSCGSPVINELVGQWAALNVIADLTPLTPEQQEQLREPNRLIWCLRTNSLGHKRLFWVESWHPPDCRTGAHVADHLCPPAAPTTLF
ncbi:hypothetical protein ACFYOF_06535 [Streptomyces sp. NPDC007148]|uniref:hypothetical protein n=1 Tax=Streptomyces sp. NPDC007148 TaxID=3364775 RepID=UPI00367CE073